VQIVVDLQAISLGPKIATVSVLELLARKSMTQTVQTVVERFHLLHLHPTGELGDDELATRATHGLGALRVREDLKNGFSERGDVAGRHQ
jgi:hypothetical protein